MEIVIGMLTADRERREKYKRIIEYLLAMELHKPVFLCYDTLSRMYEAFIYGSTRADILLLQADRQNFEFAEKLRLSDRNCLILYPARNMDLAMEAFASMPMAYVLPRGGQGADTLAEAIRKAVRYLDRTRREIAFETKSRILHYALYEVDYFESQYRIVHIVKRNGSRECITARLDDVAALLPPCFCRCHQSYLVNMDNIASVDKGGKEVFFESGQSVPSSRKLFGDFLEAYRAYQGGKDHGGTEIL